MLSQYFREELKQRICRRGLFQAGPIESCSVTSSLGSDLLEATGGEGKGEESLFFNGVNDEVTALVIGAHSC